MSERLAPAEADEPNFAAVNDPDTESWAAGEKYAQMKVDVGELGDNFYYSLPTFTILVKTEEELGPLNEEFSALFSKYTDQIIVGTPHEATLILSLNQAAAELDTKNNVITFLRERIKEVTGSYEAAGDWHGDEE